MVHDRSKLNMSQFGNPGSLQLQTYLTLNSLHRVTPGEVLQNPHLSEESECCHSEVVPLISGVYIHLSPIPA